MAENSENHGIMRMKKFNEKAIIPERKTDGSAGFDLCACIDKPHTLKVGEIFLFPTGLGAEIPTGCAGMVFTRSGLGVKHGVAVANGVGVIDSDYRGEIFVGLRNFGQEDYTVMPGERIAQLVIMPVILPDIEEVGELSQTERGVGGFGSTGR